MQDKPFRFVSRSQDFHRIARHLSSVRDFRQKPAVGAAESKLAVGLPVKLVAFLVDCTMVPATKHSQIREHGRASLRPV